MTAETAMERHFVTFYSPGTFLAETSEKPVASWDVETAVAMARDITERYNAHPYGFRFTTRARRDDELDSKVVATSGMYFLGGTVRTLAEVEADNDPKEEILRSNMRGNGYERIVRTNSPWKWTQPLEPGDVVLDTLVPSGRPVSTRASSAAADANHKASSSPQRGR